MSPSRDVPAGGSGRRPLTARSVIASTLLGVDPPQLPALALVRSGELFGLSEGATRTALSRMAATGEVVVDGEARYSLQGPLLERHARQQAARGIERHAWDGTWVAAVVVSERRPAADRAAFRAAAARLKLAEVRDGLWARPDDLDRDRAPEARAVVDAQVTWWLGIVPDDPAELVAAFDPARWAATARVLIEEMESAQAALDQRQTEVLGATFVTAAAVLRHLLADPDLPPELLPPGWPGRLLRDAFARFDEAFKATWRRWYQGFQGR